jgi:hypothetical protein
VKHNVASPGGLALTIVILLVLTACDAPEEGAAADNPALATPVPEGMVRGTVLETMDSGGYTYVLVDTA